MISPLNWKTDPFLLNQLGYWSLNSQLENCENTDQRKQILENPLKNFYGVLIKKRDFQRRKNTPKSKRIRILARMPYISLEEYPFLEQKIVDNSWQLAEVVRDYFYHSAQSDHSISSWKQRIERYANKGSIPLPILRVDQEIWKQFSEHIHQEQQIIIQSVKQESSKIPLKLSEKLVYLLGMVDGDGHLTKHQVHIVDYSKEQIKQLQKIVKELFAIEGEVRKGNGGKYYVLLANGKWVVRLINYLTEHALGRKYQSLREPLILREKPYEHLRGAYWRGLFDADAGYKRAVVFTSKSKQLIEDLECYLKSLTIKFVTRTANNAYNIYIYSGSRRKLFKGIGSWHPEKADQLRSLVKKEQARLIIFQGVKKNSLTPEGYFDFSLLPGYFSVANGGRIIKRIRLELGLSRKNLAKQLGISYNKLATYEIKRVNPPLSFFIEYVNYRKESLMPFLAEHSLDSFQTTNSKVRLPFKPTKELLTILNKLYPLTINYIGLRTTQPESIATVERFFDITIDTQSNRLSNSIIHHFLTTFCLYD
jgi:transcriptional regulator with XRE-family HTH domain